MCDDDLPEITTVPADRIVCGLLYLMTRWCERGGSAPLALAVGQHLALLAAHPDASEPLRANCLRLREQWRTHAAAATAHTVRGPLH
jgi:hypothetical protein